MAEVGVPGQRIYRGEEANRMHYYDQFRHFSDEELHIFAGYIGSLYRHPDLVIAGDNDGAYLYRWVIVGGPKQPNPNVYAHLQVASDPARPLHTHPWDNMSVILAGSYIEVMATSPDLQFSPRSYVRKKGDVIFRKADWAHRLILPKDTKATMTLFSSGPEVNGGKWGFWYRGQFHDSKEYLKMLNGASHYTGPEGDPDDTTYTL